MKSWERIIGTKAEKMIYDDIIIGGGFYGLYSAWFLSSLGRSVAIVESNEYLMARASYSNQARVHNGYHYPRSMLTATRSRINYPVFTSEFSEAVSDKFSKVYAVAHNSSKISSSHFFGSMKRVGAKITEADSNIKKKFNKDLIEDVFLVEECAFDSVIIKEIMISRLIKNNVHISLNSIANKVRQINRTSLVTTVAKASGEFELISENVYSCLYSQTNELLFRSGLKKIPLKNEIAEIVLITPPNEIADMGITVVDGPFFSTMPFPSQKCHSLSHVRYTPHGCWFDQDVDMKQPYQVLCDFEKKTNYPYMIKDSARFLPCLNKSKYLKSLWEVKTILPRSESDDSRPILFRASYGIPKFNVIMGGKIDNVYDVISKIKTILEEGA